MERSHLHSHRMFIAVAIAASLAFLGPLASVNAGVGNLDPKFGKGGKVITHLGIGDRVASLLVQPDGKIIATGASGSRDIYSASDFALVRYNADGSLDSSFGIGGKVITDFFGGGDYINSAALQSDGRIVVAGRAGKQPMIYFGLARYNKD